MNKSVTGCIVTYNNIKTIEKAVRTVLECKFRNLHGEAGGQRDGDGFRCANAFLEGVCGHGDAMLAGFFTADDIISNMARFLDENEDVGMLSPEIRFPDGRMQILGKKIPQPQYLIASRLRGDEPSKLLREYAMMDEDMSSPVEIQNATGCFMFIRTSLFKQLGGFDKRYFMYFEDCDLTRSVNKVSKVLYYPYATVYHEWGRESKKNMKLKFIQLNSMLKYYSKWGLSSK